MTEGNFPGKECTKQLLLYLLTGDVKANFSRDTITLPNLIMAQCNVKANFRESRDTITFPNLVMTQYNVKANFIESRDTITLPNLIMAQCNVSDKTK